MPTAPMMVGGSSLMGELRDEIQRIARCDARVLITGETGVGKELVAQEIHEGSRRAAAPFVKVNCAGVPEALLEWELFGHAKGGVAGPHGGRAGKLEMANAGTVFLDEVAEMPPRVQGLVLRFLESGELEASDAGLVRVDVRLLATTSRDLPLLIAESRFREDLYFRLNVLRLAVPPLRERREDIPVMIEHFQQALLQEHECPRKAFTPEALSALVAYRWPGNVRELRNVIQRLVVTGPRDVIDLRDLPLEIRGTGPAGMRSAGDRRRTIADELYHRMTFGKESFWTVVYPLYMAREISNETVRELVALGLKESRGSYRILVRLFNMRETDYKRFLNFLRKHRCHMPYRDYRV